MISQLGRVRAEVFWGGLSNMRTVVWSRDTNGLREWLWRSTNGSGNCVHIGSLRTGWESKPEQKLVYSCVPKLSTVMLGLLSLPCDTPCEWIILRHDPWLALNVCFSFYIDVHFLASYLFYLLAWFIQTSLGGVRTTPIYLIFNN